MAEAWCCCCYDRQNTVSDVFGFLLTRLPVVSDCSPQQTPRASSNSSSSTSSSGAASAASSGSAAGMAVSRVPSPPPPEVNTPVAENWCYTQVHVFTLSLSSFSPFLLIVLSVFLLHIPPLSMHCTVTLYYFLIYFYANDRCFSSLTFHCVFSPICLSFYPFLS